MFDVWGQLSVLVKFLLYLCVFVSSGLAINLVVFNKPLSDLAPMLRRIGLIFSLVAGILVVLAFALRGGRLMDDMSGLTDPDILALLWETPPGDVLLFRLIGLAIMILGFLFASKGRWVAIAGVAPLLWSFSEIGHVGREENIALQAVLFAHLVVAAFWIGVFIPLRRLANDEKQQLEAGELALQFGRIAIGAVPILIVAGVVLAWNIVGDWSTLLGTEYGLVLMGKILVVAVLLMLAGINKIKLSPGLVRGDVGAGKHLATSIQFEWLCVVFIFAATAVFTSVLTVPS